MLTYMPTLNYIRINTKKNQKHKNFANMYPMSVASTLIIKSSLYIYVYLGRVRNASLMRTYII